DAGTSSGPRSYSGPGPRSSCTSSSHGSPSANAATTSQSPARPRTSPIFARVSGAPMPRCASPASSIHVTPTNATGSIPTRVPPPRSRCSRLPRTSRLLSVTYVVPLRHEGGLREFVAGRPALLLARGERGAALETRHTGSPHELDEGQPRGQHLA